MMHVSILNQFFQYTLFATMVAMGAAFVYFVIQSSKVAPAYRSIINLSALIVGVATVMYAFMAIRYNPAGPSFRDQGLLQFRYVDWTVTTPLLVIKFPELLGIKRKTMAMVLALADIEMIMAGYIGSLSRTLGPHLIWGAISTLGYIAILALLLLPLRRVAGTASPSISTGYSRMLLFVLIGWGVYPIVYLFPAFGASAAWMTWGQIASNVADVINKVGFGLVTSAAVIGASASPIRSAAPEVA